MMKALQKSRAQKHFQFPSVSRERKWIRLAADESLPRHVQLLRTGTFYEKRYGKFSFSPADLAELKRNFDQGVAGVDPAIDYSHDSHKDAAAWILGLELRDDGNELWAEVEWTAKGEQLLLGKSYRYLSADISFKHRDNETLKEYGMVLLGAGVTNRPVIKNMAPITGLSEGKGQVMAIKKVSSKSKHDIEELRRELAEERTARTTLQMKLDEMADDNDDDEDDDLDPEKATPAQLKAGYKKLSASMKKLSEEMKGMKESSAKDKAKAKLAEQKSEFNRLLAAGKVVEAQREPFMDGDSVKFAELAQPVNFGTRGVTGDDIVETDSTAQDKVLQLAEDMRGKEKGLSKADAINRVLKTDKKLRIAYEKETSPFQAQ